MPINDGDQHEFIGHIATGLIVAVSWPYLAKSMSCAIAYNTPHECFQQYSGYDAAIATDTADTYEADQWLRVQGTFGTTLYRNRPTLVVKPDTITAIDEPQKVYINGVL